MKAKKPTKEQFEALMNIARAGGYGIAMDLSAKQPDDILTMEELACALYEGTPHLRNLAEKLARQHSSIGALSMFDMSGDKEKSFWFDIARQIIAHAKTGYEDWRENSNDD